MKNYYLVAISLFLTTLVHAQTTHSGLITSDFKFLKAGNPHVIKGMVTVEEGVELVIEAGCEIQFFDQDDEIRVYGTLTAVGTSSDKILFTGNNPNGNIHGEGLRFRPGSSNNRLEFCELTKLGDFDSVNEAIIYNEGEDLTIIDCLISDSELWGIYSINGDVNISNSQISNCFYDGLAVEFGHVVMNNCEVENCSEDGIEVFSNVSDFEIQNTIIQGNSGVGLKAQSILTNFRIEDCQFNSNYIDLRLHPFNASQISSIDASTIYLKGTLYSGMEVDINNVNQIDGVDYIVEYIQVNSGAELNIGPGTKFGFINEFSEIQVFGSMNAVGLVSDSIQFLGINPDPNIYGEGLRFHPGSTGNKLQYCYLEKLGDSSSNIASSIWYEGDEIEMTHCKIRDAEERGVYVVRADMEVSHCVFENCENGIAITETGALSLNNSDFVNCSNGIVKFISGTGDVEVHQSNFEGSTNFGIQNFSALVIDATENFWGDVSGPTHSENTGGSGDAVSDSVDYGNLNTALTENQINIGNGGIILEGQISQPLHIVESNTSYNLQTRVTNWSNISLNSCDISCDVNGAHVDIPWSGGLNFSEFSDENLGNVPLDQNELNTIAISLNTPNIDLVDNNTDNDSLEVEVLINPTEIHYGVSLDGDNDIIDFSSVADDIGTNFTFETWVKPNSQGCILDIMDGSNELLRIGRSGGQIKVFENGLNVNEIASDFISEGYWHHIAYSKDANVGTLYVDGKLVGQHDISYNLSTSNSWLAGRELNGEFDELRVWSSVRSLSEIRTWLNKENIENESGIVTGIHFREFFETRFYDYSNFNHCEVLGGTQIVSGAPVRDIDEPDAVPVECYFVVNSETENNCQLNICNGADVSLGVNPANDSWTWTWTGPNDFQGNTREIVLSNSIDESFNGDYRVLYEDNNGFLNDGVLQVNAFEGRTITVEITLDNNPEETTWELIDKNANVIATGGPFNSGDAGSVISESFCSPVDCGEFRIYDSANNGICCTNGEGLYKVLDENGDLLAFGSVFEDLDSKTICPEEAQSTCDQNVYDSNSFETTWGIWNDGGNNSFRLNNAPFANDGTHFIFLRENTSTSQMTSDDLEFDGFDRVTVDFNFRAYRNSLATDNFKFQVSTDGGATYITLEQWNFGVDYINDEYFPASVQIPGPLTNETRFRVQADVTGPNGILIDQMVISTCGEQTPDNCEDQIIDVTDLESGWGIWNDGGNNSFRINNASFASNGTHFILLRGNTGTSVTFTNEMNLVDFDEVTIDFQYYSFNMENGDQFHFEISYDGGASYSNLQTWVYGIDFFNGSYSGEDVTMAGPFTSNMRFRFRHEAGNFDYVLLDEIQISGCTMNTSRAIFSEEITEETEAFDDRSVELDLFEAAEELTLSVFPNPANDLVNIEFDLKEDSDFLVEIYSSTGKKVQELSRNEFAGKKRVLIQTDNLAAGIYFVHLILDDHRITERFVVKH